MGNCATCCGKTDGNEISTEKTVARAAGKGVQQENYENGNDINAAYPGNGKFNITKFLTHHLQDSYLYPFSYSRLR
jgi:hypothetical protein